MEGISMGSGGWWLVAGQNPAPSAQLPRCLFFLQVCRPERVDEARVDETWGVALVIHLAFLAELVDGRDRFFVVRRVVARVILLRGPRFGGEAIVLGAVRALELLHLRRVHRRRRLGKRGQLRAPVPERVE